MLTLQDVSLKYCFVVISNARKKIRLHFFPSETSHLLFDIVFMIDMLCSSQEV